jgi:hypothetical protein
MNDLGDSRSLTPLTHSVARVRGDKEPENWMPRADYECSYLASWVAVKWRWHLGVDAAERGYLAGRLAACGWPTVEKPTRAVITAVPR